ncbi:hypothetical protein DMC25_26805 [Caulobacter sp. D4A]|uniref:hypothetical protein n=1 Tax=unclassified Caulobacter TaxID=2648921 RepID=UPI000D7399F7|nr:MULTISPECIES: hypothetical protein [unclassified Caulobacter]PXA71141.1 hypothetical protein DMC25_26805 [Caulobacter sp. D4A]PXA87025.1 hypothetical protein DMC18_21370 [Caulobacter sp. D5]
MKTRAIAVAALAAAVLAGGGAIAVSAIQPPVAAPDLRSELATFRDVCIAPASHGDILRKARATGWTALEGQAVPSLLVGNGMVSLQEVREGEIDGRPVLLSVGRLGGGSFCRIYFKPADPAATVARLKAETVLGSPLGAPDFDDKLNYPEGWKAIGWHRSVADDWRALHYSFDPDGQGSNADWQAIEITREI